MNPILKNFTMPARPPAPRPLGASTMCIDLTGEITVENAIPMFRAIEGAHEASIDIAIDSTGGNALCALALFELLLRHPRHVVGTVTGRASSGAALVLMGCDRRRIARDGRILLHQTRADLSNATAVVLRETLADMATFDRTSVEIFSAATGQTPEQVAAWEREETKFDAAGALFSGLAHDIA